MGLEVLFWIWVLTWMAKTAATDVLHAVKGTPNPRYELKKQRAAQSGRRVSGQPRYGTREWFGDLYSDALAAHTEKRRQAAKAKAAPVDDMVDVVRARHETPEPPVPVPPQREEKPAPRPKSDDDEWDAAYQRLQETVQRKLAEWDAQKQRTTPDDRPLAPVIPMFPNPKQIEKEITMANSEVTGLSTAIAYADAVVNAHQSFTTSGAEGYVGALEQGGNGAEVVASAREAMEASQVAAERWAAHKSVLENQMTVKEAYQGQPDAASKEFLLAE